MPQVVSIVFFFVLSNKKSEFFQSKPIINLQNDYVKGSHNSKLKFETVHVFQQNKTKKKTKKIISFPFFFIFWLGVSGEISTDFYKNKMYKNVVFLSRSYIRSRLWGHNADQEKMSRKNKHILHWMFILRIMFILKRMTIRSFNSNATWHICPLVIMGCHFTWFYLHVLYFCRINIFLNSLFNFCSFFFTSNFPFFFFFILLNGLSLLERRSRRKKQFFYWSFGI